MNVLVRMYGDTIPNVLDGVPDTYRTKTELGKSLLALRKAYLDKGGKLLSPDALDKELRMRRGGVEPG